MPNSKEDRLEFQCPQCSKKLKAGGEIAGRKVKCPGCKAVVRVPGSKAAAPKPDDDWLSLDGALGAPAIGDLADRHEHANSIREQKDQKRKKELSTAKKRVGEPAVAQPKQIADPKQTTKQVAEAPKIASETAFDDPNAPIPFDDDLSIESTATETAVPERTSSEAVPASVTAADRSATATKKPATKKPAGPNAEGAGDDTGNKPLPSIFDDDLQLEALEPADAPPAKSKVEDVLAAHLGTDNLGDALGADDDALTLTEEDEPEETNPEYRVTCSTCGTAQYVRLSQSGKPLKCPDCYDVFKVPPPTPTQLQKNKKKKPVYSSGPDVALAAADESVITQEQRQRTQAAGLLEKAQQQITEDEIDDLYPGDFDTTTFLHRTFGCFRDPICVAQVIGYGLVYGLLFAVAIFAVENAESAFGKGLVLLTGIVGPVIGILFAMPMLSGCLALIESVANREAKVSEWPGFNLFDNIGDVLLIFAALAAAILPGFFVGSFMGRTLALGGTVQITAIMATTFALFPVFMLSMMDNGSIMQPISSAVIRSMRDAAEAWGGYYLKTLIAFGTTTLLWYLSLAAGPIGGAVAGFFLPVLAFFTCQQLGALADSIAEHLSFEFEPSGKDDDESGRIEIEQ